MLEKFEQYKIKNMKFICGGQDAVDATRPKNKPPRPPSGI